MRFGRGLCLWGWLGEEEEKEEEGCELGLLTEAVLACCSSRRKVL